MSSTADSDRLLADQPDHLRQSLRRVTYAWIFGCVWLQLTTGAAVTQFGKMAGMSKFAFGLLAAIPYLGALAQLPAAYIVERYSRRRALFILAGLGQRFTWLVISAIPWIFPNARWWWLALLALMTVAFLSGNFSNPPGMSWFSDLVPKRIRGRYLGRRNQVAQLAAAVAIVLAGYLMDRSAAVDAVSLQRAISLIFAVAALSGMLDYVFITSVRGPPDPPPNPQFRIAHLLRQPLADRNFRLFLGFNFTLTFAVAGIVQFIWLYLFNVIRMSNLRANVIFVIIPLMVTFISYPVWGRLTDRFGRKAVLMIAGVLVICGSIPWMFFTAESWIVPYLVILVGSAAWPGVDVANLNLLLASIQSNRGRAGSAYIAVYSVVVAVAGIMSGLFCGAVAESLKDWHAQMFGLSLTYHSVLFSLSGVLRALALLWLIGIQESRGYSTRGAVTYLASDIYSNLHQLVVLPVRFVTRMSEWTYKLNPDAKPPSRRDNRSR